MVVDPDEDHEYFSNFKLSSIFFKDYHLQQVLLSPSSIMTFRMIMERKAGIKCFPFSQINRYKQCYIVDLNNLFGKGCNAIISVTGYDKSMALFVAPSIEAYLGRHLELLKNDMLFVHKGEIHSFTKNPIDSKGSISVAHGIRIEMQAQLIHLFCRFDQQRFNEAPKYTFVY